MSFLQHFRAGLLRSVIQSDKENMVDDATLVAASPTEDQGPLLTAFARRYTRIAKRRLAQAEAIGADAEEIDELRRRLSIDWDNIDWDKLLENLLKIFEIIMSLIALF
jgi:hypothetical protein